MSANERQVDGNHYQASIQHWDFLVQLGYDSQYFIGQASKYLSRWRKKNGVKDLQKGQHFVQKLIELSEEHGENYIPASLFGCISIKPELAAYFDANEIVEPDRGFIETIFTARSVKELKTLYAELDAFIAAQPVPKPKLHQYQIEFVEYLDEQNMIRWRNGNTGQELDLPLSTMPMLAEWR